MSSTTAILPLDQERATTSLVPAEKAFPYPAIYSFPPFFTRQPNNQTWLSQLSQWTSLILAYCRFHRIWRLDLNTAMDWDLFNNKVINRSLKLDTAREILDSMVKKGDAEWVAGTGSKAEGKTSAIIFWRRPEEWANILADWIDSTGQRNAILTLYEIADGDLALKQDFRGIDPTILRKSLDVLVRRGQAQIMRSADGEEAGVKFFGAS
ncbi:ESCRT-II complex subunit-domain-containing protein [Lipomyces oligophaga]|uniref:ESCRT-II complex subunit-domain-containing protein n=1 Tax=Lipomyces oligophaga TaxID=45792 RepID=UPI0034CEFCA9